MEEERRGEEHVIEGSEGRNKLGSPKNAGEENEGNKRGKEFVGQLISKAMFIGL
jgi:hypothetical protein